jgi:hypothetical protein
MVLFKFIVLDVLIRVKFMLIFFEILLLPVAMCKKFALNHGGDMDAEGSSWKVLFLIFALIILNRSARTPWL